MKLVILAGGHGTRLGNITDFIPKPMVPIGGKPIIWHIMKIYSHYGIKDFVICLGYKGDIIKDYFLNYETLNSDFTISLENNDVTLHNSHDEKDWTVTLVNTGITTLKGARLKKIEKYLDDDINLLTYGDGLADININELVKFHKENKKLVTISGVHPPARFGELKVEDDKLISFEEKSQASQGLINGGFMIFDKVLLDFLTTNDNCDLESGILEDLAKEDKISVFQHKGLWACMDNERDLNYLEEIWKNNEAFWKVW